MCNMLKFVVVSTGAFCSAVPLPNMAVYLLAFLTAEIFS